METMFSDVYHQVDKKYQENLREVAKLGERRVSEVHEMREKCDM